MESGKVVAGKYRLNQLLGSGGMAEVWSATNTFTERQLAIKFMNMHLAKTPEAATRFLKEAKVSARINHPNVIDILDVGQTDEGQLFLVMELLTGFSLEVGLRRQTPPMTLYEFSLVMIEVAQALEAAHKSGIVHRDLKPSNIFLHKVRDGVAMPKVLDFGVSKFLDDGENTALTIAGTVLGSPLYMSPEQARGDANLDGRTDIFAFGAIMFEALCGFRPYEAKNFNALIIKIATTKPKNIDEGAPSVPECLRAIVRVCLETEIKARAQGFDQVIAMLRTAMVELMDSSARLPAPAMAHGAVDPEATNALPVLRASDKPAPMAYSLSGSIPPNPGSIPPSPTGPSWNTPNPAYGAATTQITRPKYPAWLPATVGGAFIATLAIGAVVGLKAGRSSSTAAAAQPTQVEPPVRVEAPPAAPAPSPTVTPSATTTPATSASSDLQAVSVESLPRVGTPVGPPPHGAGRVIITASPGFCTLFVDGKAVGATPIAGVDLATGPHYLRCEGIGGRTRTSNIVVQESTTVRYKFNFD